VFPRNFPTLGVLCHEAKALNVSPEVMPETASLWGWLERKIMETDGKRISKNLKTWKKNPPASKYHIRIILKSPWLIWSTHFQVKVNHQDKVFESCIPNELLSGPKPRPTAEEPHGNDSHPAAFVWRWGSHGTTPMPRSTSNLGPQLLWHEKYSENDEHLLKKRKEEEMYLKILDKFRQQYQ